MYIFNTTIAVLLFAASICQAAIPGPGATYDDIIELGKSPKFNGVQQIFIKKWTRKSDCSAVKLSGFSPQAVYLTAAHCLEGAYSIRVGKLEASAYFLHPLRKTDKRYDVAAFVLPFSESDAGYPIWQGEEAQLLNTPLISVGFGVIKRHFLKCSCTQPRQAFIVYSSQIDDGVILTQDNHDHSTCIKALGSTTHGDSGGGLFIEGQDGQLQLVGLVSGAKGGPGTSYWSLIDTHFQQLLPVIFSNKSDNAGSLEKIDRGDSFFSVLFNRLFGRKFALGTLEDFTSNASSIYQPTARKLYRMAEHLRTSGKYQEAFRHYLEAAKQNHTKAQTSIGVMYCNAEGVIQDFARAREWFERAAQSGYDHALYNLGLMYYNGEGVSADLVEARVLFEKAASHGHVKAQQYLDRLDTAS